MFCVSPLKSAWRRLDINPVLTEIKQFVGDKPSLKWLTRLTLKASGSNQVTLSRKVCLIWTHHLFFVSCVSKKNTPTLYVFCWNKTLYTTLHTPVQKHTPLTFRWKSLYCMGGVSLALCPLFWQFLFILGPNSPLSRTLTLAEFCQDQCVRFKTKKGAETLAGVKYNIPDCVFISILSPQTKNVSWLWAFYACRRSGSRVPGPWSPAVIDLEAKWLFKVVFFTHANRFWTVIKI